MVACTHINEAVDLSAVTTAVQRTGFSTVCGKCPRYELAIAGLNLEQDSSLWLCLKCGNQACGQSEKGHARKHFYRNFQSHVLSINTTTWRIWCYVCEDFVDINKEKLLVAVISTLPGVTATNQGAGSSLGRQVQEEVPITSKNRPQTNTKWKSFQVEPEAGKPLDQCSIFGQNVAAKLSGLPKNWRLHAEKRINDILYEVETKKHQGVFLLPVHDYRI